MAPRHILLVDDNRAFVENVAEILRDAGAEVSIALDGREALELAKRTKFDLLITDMRMPVMSGAVLVHEMHRVDPDVPAVIVTAYTGESDLADARREGVLAVLPKPVPIPQLEALAQSARRGGLVALVEDDAQLADNLSEALREKGFTALTARSALEAERLGAVRPFVALVDLKLPDAPRGEAIGRLRARYPALPVIVVTGHLESLPAGEQPEWIFTKPFDTARLLTEIEQLHARSRA